MKLSECFDQFPANAEMLDFQYKETLTASELKEFYSEDTWDYYIEGAPFAQDKRAIYSTLNNRLCFVEV